MIVVVVAVIIVVNCRKVTRKIQYFYHSNNDLWNIWMMTMIVVVDNHIMVSMHKSTSVVMIATFINNSHFFPFLSLLYRYLYLG